MRMSYSVGTTCRRCSTRYADLRAGAPWRLPPHDPWCTSSSGVGYEMGCFEVRVNNMRSVIRVSEGRLASPTRSFWTHARCRAVAKAVQQATTATSGGARCMAVDMLGLLIAMTVTSADEQARRYAQASEIDLQSNYLRRGRCLSCCPDAGWSRAVLGGFRAFDDSIVISSAGLRGLASVPAKKFAEEGRHGRTPQQQHQ